MPRMLIVDDEPDICDCLEQFFLAHGFTVLLAFNGETALQHLQQHPVDVILLDVRLPGMSGFDVLKRAKSLLPQARIIMVTSMDLAEVKRDALAAAGGACAYVSKPFDFSEQTWAPVWSS